MWISNECEYKYEYITILKQKSVCNPTFIVKWDFIPISKIHLVF